jgi:prepilin-type N-terminal cleavage/methylation domain-containing protein
VTQTRMQAETGSGQHSARRRSPGFTLIEVLAAVFLTSIVIAVALGFYINLSNSSRHAVESMQVGLDATAVLERVSRDLSGTTLLTRPDDADPLTHPWYFTATSQQSFGGSDALKFITRSQRPKVSAYHVSDLAQIAYFTFVEEDGTVTLYRWSSSTLPAGSEPGFPTLETPGSHIVAEGLRGVLFRFLNEAGEWVDEWDSTQLVASGELPSAVEVTVEMWGPAGPEEAPDQETLARLPSYDRVVVLLQRPLDLAKMIEDKLAAEQTLAAGGSTAGDVELDENGNPIEPDPAAEEDGEGMTVAECVIKNLPACEAAFGGQNCAVWSNINSLKIATFGVSIPPEWGCR